jgi:cytochrome c biogenesis protein CcdA
MHTILYSLSLSLFDSLSTTQQIIIFVLLLSTANPLKNALSYLAGLSGAYFVCGVAGYAVLDKLLFFLGKFFPSSAAISNPLYYQSEFLTGILMAAFGVWYFYRKKQAQPGRAENMILLRLKTMSCWFAFCMGIFISATSFPVSIPYLLALGKYSALHLALPSVAGWILVYNIGYALPMLFIIFVYLIALRNTDNDIMHEKAKKLNLHLTVYTLVGFGLFSMADAGCYFAIGHALVKGRFF